MTILRRTFVVHLHADRTAILEDVRAGSTRYSTTSPWRIVFSVTTRGSTNWSR
jgi:hypothetical protein